MLSAQKPQRKIAEAIARMFSEHVKDRNCEHRWKKDSMLVAEGPGRLRDSDTRP